VSALTDFRAALAVIVAGVLLGGWAGLIVAAVLVLGIGATAGWVEMRRQG